MKTDSETLDNPISFSTLQKQPGFAEAEPIVNNQGSLFSLTEAEYQIVRGLMDPPIIIGPLPPCNKQEAMQDLFLSEEKFDMMLDALREKQNVILQGAPGVGKTFVARRLAYAFIEAEDPLRVEMIQFHQSYTYEDFIQGFRPTPEGKFVLKKGIFHEFCRRAQKDESSGKRYMFIIDEINRGNLSKIFGELLMLIEPDKRGMEYSMPLTYSESSDQRFYLPKNLYLLGLMNTADRSLAMVDYALRRRFRFINLEPAFGTSAFQNYLKELKVEPALVQKIVSRMGELNTEIAVDKNLGSRYQIGHSYFCPLDKIPPDQITPDEDWFRRVVSSEIVPLLHEYWFDDEMKVEGWAKKLLD